MTGWTGLVQVTTPSATFGLIVTEGIVTEAAPYGRRSVGLTIQAAADYWRSRGARVEAVPTGGPSA